MSAVCCEHEHKVWRYTRNAWQVRLLRKPLFRTYSLKRAENSRFVWGQNLDEPERGGFFTLSLLGILHGLFGIVLWIED